MRNLLIALLIMLLPLPLLAQQDDEDFLTNFLQDNLSGAGRVVDVTGFRGALSSRATMERLTIADEQGIWLQVDNVVLDWTRSALFAGRVEINEFSAEEITLFRRPVAEDAAPTAEATEFALPELPVSVDIGTLRANRVTLEEPVFGERLVLSLEGAAALNGRGGNANFIAQRIDGVQGRFAFDGAYAPETTILGLSLDVAEGPAGIAARLIGLPEKPSLNLTINGEAPISEFAADIQIATDGQARIAGNVGVDTQDDGTQAYRLDIGGDLATLLPPDKRPFFSGDTQLSALAQRDRDGRLSLNALDISGPYVALKGAVDLNADFWPTRAKLSGQILARDGGAVPLATGMSMDDATLDVTFDASVGDAWTGQAVLNGLTSSGGTFEQVKLDGRGIVRAGEVGIVGMMTADLDLNASGITLADAGLAQAIGNSLSGTMIVTLSEDQPLAIPNIRLSGNEFQVSGRAVITGLSDALQTTLNVDLNATDFSQFSGVAGQALAGSGDVNIKGDVVPLTGGFDLTIQGEARDLAAFEVVLPGDTSFFIQALRNTGGVAVNNLSIRNDVLTADGFARIDAGSSDLNFRAALQAPELNRFSAITGQELRGAATLSTQGVINLQTQDFNLTLDGAAEDLFAFDLELPNGTKLRVDAMRNDGSLTVNTLKLENPILNLDVSALMPAGSADVSYEAFIQATDLSSFAALTGQDLSGGTVVTSTGVINLETRDFDIKLDGNGQNLNVGSPQLVPILAGQTNVALDAKRQSGRVELENLNVRGRNINLSANGTDQVINFDGALSDLGLIAPDFPGRATGRGTLRQMGDRWQVELDATGPGNTTGQIAGTIGPGNLVNVSARGTAPLGLANVFITPRRINGSARYDLRLNGRASVENLTGTISTENAQLTAPNLRIALEWIAANIDLSGGRADVRASARFAQGGRLTVNGPIGLTAPFTANLIAEGRNVRFTDNSAFDTTADARITIQGPLAGGAEIKGNIDLGQTELRLAPTGVTPLGELPTIVHKSIRPRARATLERAGLTQEQQAQSNGPAYPLNIRLRAPARIFVRGRGLDAELGGELRLTGTTAAIIPQGRFDLVRGRLDILNQRFLLTDGYAQLLGNFDPYIRLIATTQKADTEVSVVVEGVATEPSVTFMSSPSLPQDEVLSLLLFDRDLTSISPFQALQLASAVATLAGSGGGGIMSKLREGFQLDDLDVTSTDNGATAVRAGKYISDKVYTEIETTTAGDSRVNLNLDISKNVTARGGLSNSGETSLGIFFEKDY